MRGRNLKWGEKALMFSTKLYSWEKPLVKNFIKFLRGIYTNELIERLKKGKANENGITYKL